VIGANPLPAGLPVIVLYGYGQASRTIMKSSAGVIARGEGADVGDRKRAPRKRAVGTREHIIAYLDGNTELYDPGGMASTRLAAAVGYPGSSVAFAQLLSGMERSGLIERDVRGKRTYRIRLGSVVDPSPAEPAGGSAAGSGPGFDYDELARRLLAQVVRRLGFADPAAAPDPGALRETVAALEYDLADAWAKHGKLAEENLRLREQLRATEQSLALAQESLRRLPIAADLDHAEVVLLQRLLAGETAAQSLRA
jgi:hypothetical protein